MSHLDKILLKTAKKAHKAAKQDCAQFQADRKGIISSLVDTTPSYNCVVLPLKSSASCE